VAKKVVLLLIVLVYLCLEPGARAQPPDSILGVWDGTTQDSSGKPLNVRFIFRDDGIFMMSLDGRTTTVGTIRGAISAREIYIVSSGNHRHLRIIWSRRFIGSAFRMDFFRCNVSSDGIVCTSMGQ
jgi:hypothetical protein